MPTSEILVAALYKFVTLPDYRVLRVPLQAVCDRHGVKGTLLLAPEGINGTIAGTPDGIEAVLGHLHSDPRLADLAPKFSHAHAMPFYRMKVRLKREIVTMGVPDMDPTTMAGTYVPPEAWNRLIESPDVVLIDARNDYEVEVGTFRGAINPETKSFRELPSWLRSQDGLKEKPRVAMFCTGGIRCEKSTAFLKAEGFEEVYHLQGGILNYLEHVPESESLWEGECFVFDQRVAVGHGLEPGSYDLCHACRYPITEAEKASADYEPGVSCPRCMDRFSDDDRERFRERQRQIRLARERGEEHLGASADPA